jgi:uncharacterized protein (UPF0216 family)
VTGHNSPAENSKTRFQFAKKILISQTAYIIALISLRGFNGTESLIFTHRVTFLLEFMYCRFDEYDFKNICTDILNSMNSSDSGDIVIDEEEVVKVFSGIKVGKAAGPDKMNGRVIKLCKYELAKVFTRLFQCSISTHCIPTI